jgi:hypothetical protein
MFEEGLVVERSELPEQGNGVVVALRRDNVV